jgi:uncharacterized protein (TIGR02118 family)
MIVRMGLFRKKADLSTDQFAEHWRERHGPLVKSSVRALDGYIQNLVVDRTQKGMDYQRADFEVDAISQLFFKSLSSMRRSVSGAVLDELKADEERFMEGLVVMTAVQNTVFAPTRSGKCMKRMSLIKKREDMSSEEFQHQWFDVHSVLVKRLPGLLGYRQNLTIDWQVDRYSDESADAPFGVDGVVELWFEDGPAIVRAFRSPAGATAMSHAQEFLGQVSTYVVDPVGIVPEGDLSRLQAA